ncbi:restriction endonuclease subunit S [Agromyces sp. H66]|uniref:restriction endonuclease subunit S n=1 Tax=Agromyces sp. H66 TaxID=2529859 RepID=UPI0010AA0B8A|nr:restriction endonuclease subunit S [Agromyces sp. H66]
MTGEVRLGDVTKIDVGFPFKSECFSENPQDIRLLRGDNIAQGRLRWAGVKRWPIGSPYDSRYALAPGDVVLAMDRPWIEAGLKQATVRDDDLPAVLVQRVARLRGVDGKLDQGYLAAIVSSGSFSDYLVSVQTGSAVPHISGRQIAEFSLRLPPIGEQRAIAEVLGALDDKIAANTKLAATARELALAMVPTTGDRVTVLEFATLQKTQVDPGTLGDEVVDHYSLPAFDSGDGPELVEARNIKSSKFVVSEPCVLISKLNPRFPRVWDLARVNGRRALASTEFLVLEPREISTSVLWSLLAQPSFGRALESKVAGTSGSHQRVKPIEVLEARVSDPRGWPEESRATIESLASAAMAADAENRTLAEMRDALVPQLISGKLRVRAWTDEV